MACRELSLQQSSGRPEGDIVRLAPAACINTNRTSSARGWVQVQHGRYANFSTGTSLFVIGLFPNERLPQLRD